MSKVHISRGPATKAAFDSATAFRELARPAYKRLAPEILDLIKRTPREQASGISFLPSASLGRACMVIKCYALWSHLRWRAKLVKPVSGAKPVAEFPMKRKAEAYIAANDKSGSLPGVTCVQYGYSAKEAEMALAFCELLDAELNGRLPVVSQDRTDRTFRLMVAAGWMVASYYSAAGNSDATFRILVCPAVDAVKFKELWESRPAWDGVMNEVAWVNVVALPHWEKLQLKLTTKADKQWIDPSAMYHHEVA